MSGTGSPRKGRKYAQIVDGARDVFLTNGYEGASVDAIAREAGVSKATLYSYFPDKRELFIAIFQREIDRLTIEAFPPQMLDLPIRERLTHIGHTISNYSTSHIGLALFRLAVSEVSQFPELGRAFYEAGPVAGKKRMADAFRLFDQRGELRIEDFEMATEQFFMLCRAGSVYCRLFLDEKENCADPARAVEEAVTTFLARYEAR